MNHFSAMAMLIMANIAVIIAAIAAIHAARLVLKMTRANAALVVTWESLAAGKFRDAEVEKDEMGRKLIEHGAMCYLNCARQLKEAMQDPVQCKVSGSANQ